MAEGYLTSGQAARMLGVSKGTVLEAVAAGTLRAAFRMPGGAYRFMGLDVQRFTRLRELAQQAREPGRQSRVSDLLPRRPLLLAGIGAGTGPALPEGQGEPRPGDSITAWVERFAAATTAGQVSAESQIDHILTLLAESLRVGTVLIARPREGTWRIDRLHDRVGMGLRPGADLPCAEILGRALAAGAGASLIVEDVGADARCASLEVPPGEGIGALAAVALTASDGGQYGALCLLHPSARAVPGGEVPVLRLAAWMVMRAVETVAARDRELRLALQAAQLAVVVEQSEEAIFRVSPDGRIETWNGGAARLYGYTAAEAIGRHVGMLVPGEYRAEQATLLDRVGRGQPIQSVETLRQRKDGSAIEAAITLMPIRNSAGEVVGASVIARDTSDRRRTEDALRESAAVEAEQARIATALAEASAFLASGLEPEGLYETILRRMVQVVPGTSSYILAYQEGWAVVMGMVGEPSLPPGTRVALLEGAEGLFPRSPGQARLLSETRGARGWRSLAPWVGEYEVRSTIVVPLIVHGETYGCVGVGSTTAGVHGPRHFQVVHAFAERLMQALWNARLYQMEKGRARAAEQLAALRSDFVSTVSHELRTPLAAALGYAEMLESRWAQLTEGQRRLHVQRIVQAANRQKRLIDDLLRVSTLEAEQLTVQWQEVALVDVVCRAMEMVNGSYPKQVIDAEGPPGLTVVTDGSHLEQVLTNLLDNAAKYSAEGSPIEVRWALEDGMVAVRVRDHGPGIPQEGREVLFTRFGRVPGSRMRAGHVGTGLGLYLGRALAEAMGGSLDLESTGNEGSTFRVCLPLERPKPRPAVATARPG